MNSVTQMVVATPVAVALGAFAGLMFSTVPIEQEAGVRWVVARSALALVPALVVLVAVAWAGDQLWIGSCIPFGIALAYEREERARLTTTVIGIQIAIIAVSFPFVWAVTGLAQGGGS